SRLFIPSTLAYPDLPSFPTRRSSDLVDALLGRLAETQSEEADSAAEKEGILAEPSESLRRSAQRYLCMGNPGERTQDSRDRHPCTTHRPGGGTSPQPGGKS